VQEISSEEEEEEKEKEKEKPKPQKRWKNDDGETIYEVRITNQTKKTKKQSITTIPQQPIYKYHCVIDHMLMKLI
jgi:hypothetical protein